MLARLRNRQRGFTLIELLIVVAIIGIIAALLIPNFLDALQKAKQKRTVADARNVGTAEMSWLTDQISAAAAGAASTQVSMATTNYPAASIAQLEERLVDQYIQDIPNQDGWKCPYDYRLNIANPGAATVMAIVSHGLDDNCDGTTNGTYNTGAFDPTDYEQDIVWADGFFVRWPQKLS
jgi:type II secretion system protein G